MGSFLSRPDRVKYDDLHGEWRVVFHDKEIKQPFKNSQLAYEFLRKLVEQKVQPEY